MRIHFFGRDRNKLQLCEASAKLLGLESATFETEQKALYARPSGEALIIASENVIVSQRPEISSSAIINPGGQNCPSKELTVIGSKAEIRSDVVDLTGVNRGEKAVPLHFNPEFLSGFQPNVPLDYDFTRYRSVSKFISFSKVPNGGGNRAHAMAEMLLLLQNEPYDFSDFVEKRIVRELAQSLRDGDRMEPVEPADFGIERIISVCDSGFEDDLQHLIPTAVGHHPDAEFHLFCDRGAAKTAKSVVQKMIPSAGNVHIRPEITKKSIQDIEKKFNGINQSDYWRPGPIWWKLEALRKVLAEDPKPTLLVDCDITFAAPVRERFREVDLVMSPFYWPNPNLKVRISPKSEKFVPIPDRDGWFNAGYVLATRPEVAETWLELYEQSVGGFYEQYCMGFLPQRFRHDVFGTAHNWGQWRSECPPKSVVSLHAHRRTEHNQPVGDSIQARAREAASQFLK